MTTGSLWIIKVILSHLITDFILQPSEWVKDRNRRHFRSSKLYLHGVITGLMPLIFVGWHYWIVGLIILVTHIIIDGWKSFQQEKLSYFLLDQSLHLLVIAGCWYWLFFDHRLAGVISSALNVSYHFWVLATATLFLTSPAGILIGILTRQWREKIENADSLANAGKWIGMIERIIVLILVLQNQYSAIGLLITAKGIIRFNEKDRAKAKTEYLVIGTLLSIGLAIATGLCVAYA